MENLVISDSPPQSLSELPCLWEGAKSVRQPDWEIEPDLKSFSGHFIVAITKKKTGTPVKK